eukprot:g27268.t1
MPRIPPKKKEKTTTAPELTETELEAEIAAVTATETPSPGKAKPEPLATKAGPKVQPTPETPQPGKPKPVILATPEEVTDPLVFLENGSTPWRVLMGEDKSFTEDTTVVDEESEDSKDPGRGDDTISLDSPYITRATVPDVREEDKDALLYFDLEDSVIRFQSGSTEEQQAAFWANSKVRKKEWDMGQLHRIFHDPAAAKLQAIAKAHDNQPLGRM